MSEQGSIDGTVEAPAAPPSAEDLINAVAEIIREARPVPLSSNVGVPRDELLAALEQALASLPEEVRAARWLLKEKEEFLASARAEADEIVAAGRHQAEQMVRRTELVRQSEIYGRRIRDEAEAEARHWRRQTEDYCERRLEQFELTLGKIARSVQEGRDRLRALPSFDGDDAEGDAGDDDGDGHTNGDVIDLTDERVAGGQVLFDQDVD